MSRDAPGEQPVQQQAATHVDGGADDQQDDRRDQRELDEGLAHLAVRESAVGSCGAHHDVVVLLEPEIVIRPPKRLRSLNP